jgi:hypothetical protein
MSSSEDRTKAEYSLSDIFAIISRLPTQSSSRKETVSQASYSIFVSSLLSIVNEATVGGKVALPRYFNVFCSILALMHASSKSNDAAFLGT